jgi:hypothetical protein
MWYASSENIAWTGRKLAITESKRDWSRMAGIEHRRLDINF